MKKRERGRFFTNLAKTRGKLLSGLQSVVPHGKKIDMNVLEEIEDHLILSDLGVEVSSKIVESVRLRGGVYSIEELRARFQQQIVGMLEPVESPLQILDSRKTQVILVVGVNGVGKTTTVAKLTNRLSNAGYSVMLAGCDTFRAAAIEQLQSWGEKLKVPVIAQQRGTDAAAVAHDAFESALARHIDVLIIDSAGRQHVNVDLMEQLKKIDRVLARIDPTAPHETMLVVDAGNGQNILSQTEVFNNAVNLTGICITKLDGTARGGVTVALARKFGIPIRFVSTGERLEDFAQFEAEAFAEALLPMSDEISTPLK